MTQLQKLESHKRPVMNLQFSPWIGSNDPLILLSISESIVFWNIRSIQNNPLEMKKSTSGNSFGPRVSQRFKSPMKIVRSPSTEFNLSIGTEKTTFDEKNPWRKKAGSHEKPELLSCIKLVAKSAKQIVCNNDFTRFVTIDNEGNIYHLRMVCDSLDGDSQKTIDFNGSLLLSKVQ